MKINDIVGSLLLWTALGENTIDKCFEEGTTLYGDSWDYYNEYWSDLDQIQKISKDHVLTSVEACFRSDLEAINNVHVKYGVWKHG